MPESRARREEWEYPSLEWIHRAREKHYEEEKDKNLFEIEAGLSPAAEKVAQRLSLEAVPASQLPHGRRRTA